MKVARDTKCKSMLAVLVLKHINEFDVGNTSIRI